GEKLPVVIVAGRVSDGALTVDGQAVPTFRATLGIASGKRGLDGSAQETVRAVNVPWRPGRLDRPIGFVMSAGADGVDPATMTWSLKIARVDGYVPRVVREMAGQGLPPASLQFDGTEAGGTVGVFERGGLYQARLTVGAPGAGTLATPPVAIGVSYGEATAELSRKVLRDGLFDEKMEPTARLKSQLRLVASKMTKGAHERLLVEVHTDATDYEDGDFTRTRRAAYSLSDWAKKELGWGGDRFIAVGLGGSRPLRPNVGERNRAYNRRVEIAVLPAEDVNKLTPPPAPEAGSAAVRVQDETVAIAADGGFLQSLARPSGRPVAVVLTTKDGATRTLALRVDGAPAAADDEAMGADPLRKFGGKPLADALGKGAVVDVGAAPQEGAVVTAGNLRVRLPPKGTTLATTRFYLVGDTDPANTVVVNGKAVRVDASGHFEELIALPSGKSDLVIDCQDAGKNGSRIVWPVEVTDTELFLLALVDGVGGQVGARLQELGQYDKTDNGTLFLAGRGALYAKARISGTALAKDLFITAHLDSTKEREFEAFYEQVVDPARDYVIFGDSATDEEDAASRGKLYVLVQADRSKLQLGNFRTDFQGVELVRYQRSFYGGKLEVRQELAPGWDLTAKAFVSEDNRTLVRRHDELAATGGSLYYLSNRELVEGSEQVWLVVREQDTGMELARTRLTRDDQYRVDYRTGRLTFAGPISTTMDALFAIEGYQPFTGRQLLDGHPIFVVVDYESRAVESAGGVAWGVEAAQTIADVVEVGGTYVREGRPAGTGTADPDDDYQLYGGHVKVKLSPQSQVFGEVARSEKTDGVALASVDGGLAYHLLDRSGGTQNGTAVKVGGDLRLGEIFADDGLDLRVQGWWQLMEEGFHSVGLASEQGMEKWGGAVTWKATRDDRLDLRYDGGTVLIADDAFDTGFRAEKRNRLAARYEHDFGRFGVSVEGTYGQHRDDLDGKVYDAGGFAVGGRFELTPRLSLSLVQEGIVGGDDAIFGSDGFESRFTTSAAIAYKLTEGMGLRLAESVRWNGDNATRIGLHTHVGDGSTMYVEDRLGPATEGDGRVANAVVVGADQAFADGTGRAYGEYRMDTGVDARTNRAVVGVGKRFELAPGVRVTGAYERSYALSGVDQGLQRDVVSAGLEAVAADRVKLGGVAEVRLDQPKEGGEVVQAVVRGGVDAKVSDALTILGVGTYTVTQNLDSRDVLKEDLEATLGFALRPLHDDDLILIGRYSRVLHREQISAVVDELAGVIAQGTTEEATHLASLAAIIELGARLQLTEKIAWKHAAVQATGTPDASYDLLLWINRLAFHLIERFDIATELRLLASLGDTAVTEEGAIVEVAYNFFDHVRLGVGWNINGVAGALLPGSDGHDVENGFYVRLTGTY
ncbi:MAG: hypothetical protein KC635_05155, partial [Myxococcales bacterium]|nr:hypothetical protein [Myxococcales bacterium]